MSNLDQLQEALGDIESEMDGDSALIIRPVGHVAVIARDSWSCFELRLESDIDEELLAVDIELPDEDDPEPVGIQTPHRYSAYSIEETNALIELLKSAVVIVERLNESMAEAIAAAEARRAEAEKLRMIEQAKRDQIIEERTERLLTEFIGETVRVRERGYKSGALAEVTAREVYGETDVWQPHFNWLTDHIRTQNIDRIPRLDVKVFGKWETVWDDGTDDLSGWDKEITWGRNARKYDGGLG